MLANLLYVRQKVGRLRILGVAAEQLIKGLQPLGWRRADAMLPYVRMVRFNFS